VHFVALDTERAFQDTTRRAAQLAWLRDDLAATSKPWKVVYFHRAPYSADGEHGSDLTVRQTFGPIFEEFGVQVALTGHEHMYERTVPLRVSTDRTHQAVTYFVAGGGGARLYPAGLATWTAFSRSYYQYLRVNIDGCVMTTRSIDRNGTTGDTHVHPRSLRAGLGREQPDGPRHGARGRRARLGQNHDLGVSQRRRARRESGLLPGRRAEGRGPHGVVLVLVELGQRSGRHARDPGARLRHRWQPRHVHHDHGYDDGVVTRREVKSQTSNVKSEVIG
jgi:hypothetical protein